MLIVDLIRLLIVTLFFLMVCSVAMRAQTASFTYQGKLTDGGAAASGSYQMRFSLFDAAAGGNQIGATVTNPGVAVANGIFTVNLDFGAAAFPGAARFLEIGVFSTATNSYVVLNPRQPLTSAPYAVRSLNSTTAETAGNSNNLGGVPADQYVQTNDSRLSDDRNPLAGSGFYIQNRTTVQTGASFNISGNGTAGGTLSGDVVNSNSQYNIGNSRVLSVAGTNNTFTGFGAGASNAGVNNSFFGRSAGFDNTTGAQNSFFGSFAGANNSTGAENSFFGSGAGDTNTTGGLNSFFGRSAGTANTSGSSNTFIGRESGLANTSGFFNSFVGRNAGGANTTGFQNAFFGANAGGANTIGNNNTFIGFGSGNTSGGCIENNNTLIGSNTSVSCVFSPVSNSVAIGAGATVDASDTIVLGTNSQTVKIPGTVDKLRIGDYLQTDRLYVDTLPGGGGTDICIRTSDRVIAQCSSSIRYKDNVTSFNPGLDLVRRLRPVTFNWKSDGARDLGLVAEEVAEAEPLLATSVNGRVEGVKYDRVGVVLINAVKEQQAEIESLKQQIELLKKLVCAQNGQAEVCK
jgi:hypothetical protein